MANPLHPYVVPLLPTVKTYKWGRKGKESLVARLQAQNSFYPVDPEENYAELWIGTHAKSPSRLAYSDGTTLNEFIANETIEVESDKVAMYSSLLSDGLPYLLKVLSVRTALSIQAHPHLELAGMLHKKNPEAYPDTNHKPEMSVALSPFELMYGFQPMDNVVRELARVPEFANAVGRACADAFVKAVKSDNRKPEELKKLFESLMRRDPDEIAECGKSLAKRLRQMDEENRTSSDELFLLLHKQYPGDVGCFGCYLFNHVILEPGQAIYIPANEPHAYISGECVEIMACSDNVVRAGLTPKFKDVQTLVDMLTYDDSVPEVFDGDKVDKCARLYCPPIQEFQLYRVEIPPKTDYTLETTVAPTTVLVIGGEGYIYLSDSSTRSMLPMYAGAVYYLKAGSSYSVLATKMSSDDTGKVPLVFFRAGVNETLEFDGHRCSVM